MDRRAVTSDQGTETEGGAAAWVQQALYELRGRVAQLQQQVEQVQTFSSTVHENMQTVERTLGETSRRAADAPRLQEELNQAAALIVQLQDQQAELRTRLDELERRERAEERRDQTEWAEVARRTEQLQREVAQWHDRQAGVDEVGRRFQEGLSLLRQEIQQIEQRLEGAESRASRALEGANRAEHTLTETRGSILDLQREDENLAERTRVTADVVRRLEGTLSHNLQELQRLELLAERIELHRAERQRLEDRALRLEEELRGIQEWSEKADHERARMSGHQQGLSSRLDTLEEGVKEQRALLTDQIRRLIGTQDRTKRRQIQELEREIRETKQYVADLSDQ